MTHQVSSQDPSRRSDIPSGHETITRYRIPLTLNKLSEYLDWRRTTLEPSSTLHTITSIIWSFLPNASIQHYSIHFKHATDHKVLESIPSSPPVLTTTSPKGELLIMVECIKKSEIYS
eukprot:176705_1